LVKKKNLTLVVANDESTETIIQPSVAGVIARERGVVTRMNLHWLRLEILPIKLIVSIEVLSGKDDNGGVN